MKDASPEGRKTGPEGRKTGAKDGLSFVVSVSGLSKAGMTIAFDASKDECRALAALLDIPAVERVSAKVALARWRADGVKVTGRLDADVVQTDVVTLEPLAQRVAEDVDLVFVPEHSKLARSPELFDGELLLDPEGDDIPDTFTGDRIDLGAALTEILALGLDQYPRGTSTAFEPIDTDPDPEGGRVSPFAALGTLKPGAD